MPIFTLPPGYNTIFALFKPHFTIRIWSSVQLLLICAVPTLSQCTVTAILRILGMSAEVHFQNYHHVLNRAVWSSLALSRVLLQVLGDTVVPHGPNVLRLDDTIERRQGAHIRPKASIATRCAPARVTL